jgi:hypothetical protein
MKISSESYSRFEKNRKHSFLTSFDESSCIIV